MEPASSCAAASGSLSVRSVAESVLKSLMGTSDALTMTMVPLASPSEEKPLVEKNIEMVMRKPMPSGSRMVPNM